MKKQLFYIYLIILLLLLIPTNGFAQIEEDSLVIEIDSILNQEVTEEKYVHSASKYDQTPEEAPSSISVITSKEIEAFGYQSLTQLLNAQKGFYYYSDRASENIGVRGFGRNSDHNNRILLLLNGHRLNTYQVDYAPIGDLIGIEISNIERVEIVRGPGSILYGNNAVHAVINIITKLSPNSNKYSLNYKIGSNNKHNISLNFFNQLGSDLSISLFGSHMSTDGEDIYFKEFDTADNNGIAKDLDGQIVNGIYGILEFKDLKLTAMWKDHEKEIPSAPFNAEFNEYHTQFTQSEFVDLSWSPRISFDKFLILKATTDHQKYGAQVPFPFGLNVEFLGETTTWSSGLQFIWDIFPNNRIISGAEYTDNFKSNYKYFAEDVDLVNDTWSYKLFSLFFQNEYQYNADLSIYFGVRRDDFVGQEVAVNPRAGIVYSLKGEHTFKLLYGRSYRAPNLLERNLEEKNIARFKANENLKSEFINTAELIWNYKIHKNLSTSVAFYLYKMEDLIEQVEDPIDDLFQYVNKSTIYAQGVELELNYEINSFSSYIRYSFQEAKDNAKIKISNSPTHLFKVGAVHKLFGIFNVALDANLESKRKTLYNTYTAPSFLVNANLFTDKFYDNLSCSFSIRNMLNEKIMHPAGYELRQRTIVQPYRNYTFSLSYEF